MSDEQMDVIPAVGMLIDQWCQRRALGALRCILPAWPYNGLTDGADLLKNALERVRAFARDELTEIEAKTVDDAISALWKAVHRP